MHTTTELRAVAAIAMIFLLPMGLPAQTIDEIIVTADFRGRAARDVPASVTILDADDIEQLAVQHFEELVNIVPNLSWSGDGHRARYFQIRGVGELEQYQGAPNPSVGFLIDDIDFSGIGGIATLFDLQQIEVLRGPQGTRYGANALAGLIYIRSALPTPELSGRLQVTVGGDDTFSGGLAVGGPVTADGRLMFRFSAHQHKSNGFRDNPFLGRDDTNGRDETAIRARLRWLPNENLSVDLATMVTDVNDGYDAFALDNSYTVLSDKPGKDAQKSIGASLRIEYDGWNAATLTSITAIADSAIEFSYDADWGNDVSWAPVLYDYISVSDRKRQTISQEFRFASQAWLVGVYVMRLEDELVTVNQGDYYDPFYDYGDSLDDTFGSQYEATSSAIFGQYEHQISPATRLNFGLRTERRTTNYDDTTDLSADPAETMSGGELAISHDHSAAVTSFASLSKGYKAGGFNLGVVPDDRREFGAEELWNIEIGVKSAWRENTLLVNASVFLSRRDDQQVRTSFQLIPGDPASFVFFTDNAAKGETLGFEADMLWTPSDEWTMYVNVGLLNAEFDEFQTPQIDLDGRAQAHAPDYTLAMGASYRHASGFNARIDLTARDEFYFDVSHDQKSKSYELVNARIGYETDNWSVQLWARNIFDEQYAVRGFYFGNEPPDFPNALYTRAGDPRQVGITLKRSF